MSEFFIDLLPEDARKIFRQRARLRLIKLGSFLALTIATGVVISSFVELRKARAEHEVIATMRDRSSKIDELVSQAVQERDVLRSEIAADSMLRSPVGASVIIATISHLLPEGSWLESMKISLDEQRTSKAVAETRPTYVILMNGIATTSQAVQNFANDLRKTRPFAAVTIVEQRAAAKASGSTNQQFVLRMRIDTNADESENVNADQSWLQTVVTRNDDVHGEINR